MSIFNNNGFESEIVACEGYDITLGGAFDIMTESYDDDLAVIEAMHSFEIAELEAMKESGQSVVSTPVMEASLKDIWTKIKEFFKNLWQRILGFFKNVGDFINSVVMSGSAFAKKYKERLNKVKLNGFSYEMYEYKIADNFKKGTGDMKSFTKAAADEVAKLKSMKITADNALANLTRQGEKLEAEKETQLSEFRKRICGEADPEKMTEALFNKFRAGGKKKSISVSDLSQYIAFLEKSEELNKTIKEAKETVNKTFSDINNAIKDAANEAEKDTKNGEYTQAAAKKASFMRAQIGYYSACNSIYTRFVNAWSSAAREAVGTYKSLCFKALTYKAQ